MLTKKLGHKKIRTQSILPSYYVYLILWKVFPIMFYTYIPKGKGLNIYLCIICLASDKAKCQMFFFPDSMSWRATTVLVLHKTEKIILQYWPCTFFSLDLQVCIRQKCGLQPDHSFCIILTIFGHYLAIIMFLIKGVSQAKS